MNGRLLPYLILSNVDGRWSKVDDCLLLKEIAGGTVLGLVEPLATAMGSSGF